jgi:polyhydroxyalkanoate synthesis regulator phasin
VPTGRTTTRPAKRTGITRFLGNIVDDTKEFIDDVLDRTRDTEHDLRDTARRLLRYDEEDENKKQDIETLKDELDQLAEKITALSSSQSRHEPPAEKG